jgi:anti-sigma-K factor RskA
MSSHPQSEEDFELLAIGVLDGDEKAALEHHLSECGECQSRLADARGRMAMLALSAPQVSPSPELRQRLIIGFQEWHAKAERTWGAQAGTPPAPAVPLPRARETRYTRSAPLWAAAGFVLLAAAVWLAVENYRLAAELARLETTHQQLADSEQRLRQHSARAEAALDILTAPDTVKVELTPLAARPVPHGKALYNLSRGLLFYAANLRALPPDRTYELWLIPAEGAPVDAGIFNPDGHGNGQVILPELPPGLVAKAFAVTVEPAGGVPAPTGPKVLVGPVS